VLLYRRLGFGLNEIAAILDDPQADAADHLHRQRALLIERGEGIEAMIAAIDKQLEARAMGMQLSTEEQMEVFGTDKVGGEWADEADERFGETEQYQESQRRAASYTKDDWIRLKAEADDGLRRFVDAMSRGVPAGSAEVMELAEQHRAHLTRWFYDCSYDRHCGLAELYLSDERFTIVFDGAAPGLAQYVHDAILANAARG
jgi:DNA-binding transcriptional MerR regulator